MIKQRSLPMLAFLFPMLTTAWAQSNYYFANVYDGRYSSNVNWGQTNRGPDQTISVSFNGTTATATTATAVAGMVTSLKVGTQEFIASGGHGSGFGWDFLPQLPGYPSGECYNPTSGGTAKDDTRPGWNIAPWHGPSTSAILQPLSQHPSGQLITSSRFAFYRDRGEQGYGGCVASYPNTAAYSYTEGFGILSPFLMKQTVQFGRQTQVGWLANVLNVEGDTTLDANALTHGKIYNNVHIAYLLPDFTNFYYFNPDGTSDHGLHAVARASQAFYGNRLPILATATGGYAIGLIEGQSVQEARNAQQGSLPPHNERHYYYITYNAGTNGYFPLQTVQATFYHTNTSGVNCASATCENLSPGTTLKNMVHYVFGNLTDVQYALQALYNDQHDKLDPDVFNWQEYSAINSDVNTAYPDQVGAENHWLIWGINEGRKASVKFWSKAYLNAIGNEDIKLACGPTGYACAIDHYVQHGRSEGRPLQ